LVSEQSIPDPVEDVYRTVREAVGPLPDAHGVARIAPVTSSIRALALRTPTLPPATHTTCYLVGTSDGPGPIVVVDPATPHADEQAVLLGALDDEARAGRRVEAVFLTHHHRDHIGAAAAVARHTDAPVWAHRETTLRVATTTAVDREIDHDFEIALGDARVRAIHTPGHAAGHLCLHDLLSGAMIAGDMVAGIGTILIDPGDGDMAQYLASLEAMLAAAPTKLLPAHGPVIDDAPGKLREYLAHRRMREARVLDAVRVRGPATTARLVEEAYSDTPRVLWPLAERSLVSHLIKLAREGRVVEDATGWREL
jgi:glyoxylase-like metal-dependent hydrolase (beta-lactamase superfamily II)